MGDIAHNNCCHVARRQMSTFPLEVVLVAPRVEVPFELSQFLWVHESEGHEDVSPLSVAAG